MSGIARGDVRTGRWVTIEPWETGVVVRDGAIVDTWGPGRHRHHGRGSVTVLDTRPSILTIPTQEVLTSDGVQVRLSLVARVAIVDPVRWLTTTLSPLELLYTELQVALRDRVAALELAAISGARTTLLDGVEEELAEVAASVGATLTRIALKDITLPMEVRAAVAQVALTKQRGLADIERARADAAVMRSLANTAKLMAEHPELLQLKTLQAASEGAQVIIHRDGAVRQD